jgi:2-methylisocitrate lyase-like PEP mutase family enzyme
MSDLDELRQKADRFLELHHGARILVLPNAWDVASAAVLAQESFSAIGTTSAGIAATMGFADGECMRLADNMAVVQRIASYVDVPVSADVESGYEDSVEGVAKTAGAVLRAGAVGLNIEDGALGQESGLTDLSLQKEKIEAMRETSAALGVHLVINARCDAYLVGDDPVQSFRNAVERGNAYAEAGADCIFIPDVGSLDAGAMRSLVREIAAPLNIIAGTNTPPVAELQDIGISRVSVGPRPMRALLSLLREIAQELKGSGTYELMSSSSISYSDVNDWFA